MGACNEFLVSRNARLHGCERCGYLPDLHPTARDRPLERDLLALAARAAGLPGDGGLDRFADARAHPGGLRRDADWRQEACEEVADLANYCRWGMQEYRDGFLAGDSDAVAEYERFARALPHAVQAWYALLGQ